MKSRIDCVVQIGHRTFKNLSNDMYARRIDLDISFRQEMLSRYLSDSLMGLPGVFKNSFWPAITCLILCKHIFDEKVPPSTFISKTCIPFYDFTCLHFKMVSELSSPICPLLEEQFPRHLLHFKHCWSLPTTAPCETSGFGWPCIKNLGSSAISTFLWKSVPSLIGGQCFASVSVIMSALYIDFMI